MRKLVRRIAIVSGLALAGACGGKVASDTPSPPAAPPAPTPSTTTPAPSTSVPPPVKPPPDASADGRADADAGVDAGPDSGGLPPGVTAVEVNSAAHALTAEGLVFETLPSAANPPGAFNGPGAGNKAFFGFSGYDNVLLSALGTIVVRARRDQGTPFFYLNLQVDCDGSGTWNDAVDGIVVVDPEALPALALQTDAMTDVTINPSDPVFKIVGASSPPGPLKCGLFSHLSSAPRPLTDAPAAARLWNGDTGDNGMPRGTVMPAILFVLGDSNNLAARKVTVERVTIGGKVFNFMP